MLHERDTPSHAFRVAFRSIEAQLGRDRIDDAGDLMIESLNEVSDYPDQHHYEFSNDVSHPNPWYHSLIFTVWGLSETERDALEKLLAQHGLIVSSP